MSMCKACNTQNSEESRFCKMCGFELVAASVAPQIKPEEIDGLLTDGYRLVNESRIEEVEFLVDAILQVEPQNSSALALKAAVHERNGDLALAIECYEQVVTLNPDSTLDRIKLAQLQKKADAEPKPEDEELRGRNWVAIASAAAAVVVVTGLGVAIALNTAPSPLDRTVLASNEASGFETAPRPDATQVERPSWADVPPETPVGPYQGNDQVLPPVLPTNPGRSSGSGNPLAGPGIVWQPEQGRVWPDEQPNTGSGGFVLPPGPADWRESPSTTRGGTTVDAPVGPDPTILATKPKGKIEITMRSGSPGGGSDREAESANIYRVAMEKMKTGDYRGAIRDFQVALNGSGNPAQIHQFLGQCYKAAGESGNARSHYQQAISLYEAQGNANAAESCRQALRTLG